ncbi:MAG: nucleotide exchange factor GrpE [Bacteroidales bacterium]|jgi:molecular chaperone GrpE|nr:nucleotide exchange factor GrpE [Bacteroidales bacterium]
MTKKKTGTVEVKKNTKTTQQNKKQNTKTARQTDETKADKKSTNSSNKKTKVDEKEKKVEKKVVKTDKEIIVELNDKYLRLAAEFDNYRKRTLKERMDLMKSAGEDILINIIPVMDDFERGLGSIDRAKEISAVKEGVQLIYNKFKDFLKQRGVKEIVAKEKDFDTDLHEAITKIPAPNKKLKGKVVDVVEKGYYLNEKVIRFSKVVIGE